MTFNVTNGTSGNSTFFQSAYNLANDGINLVKHGINEVNGGRGIYIPFNAVKNFMGNTASLINYYAGPTLGALGNAVKTALDKDNHQATTSGFSTMVFTFATLKGAIKVFDPLKFEWIEIDYRFKPKMEVKGKLVNLSELVNKMTPDTIPSPAQVKSIADATASLEKKTEENIKIAVDEAKKAAADAKTKLVQDVIQVEQAQATATGLKTKLDEAILALKEVDTEKAVKDPITGKSEIDVAEDCITEAQKSFNKAQKQANKLMEKATKQQELATLLQNKIPKDGPKVDNAKAPQQPVPVPKKADGSNPEVTQLTSYAVEKTARKPGEYPVILPMSNNEIIFKWDALKKSLLTSLAGMPLFAGGILGGVDSYSKWEAADLKANNIAQAAMLVTTTKLAHDATDIIGNTTKLLNNAKGLLAIAAPCLDNATTFIDDAMIQGIKAMSPTGNATEHIQNAVGFLDKAVTIVRDAAIHNDAAQFGSAATILKDATNLLGGVTETVTHTIEPQSLSQQLLGDKWATAANIIGTPVQWVIGKAGHTVAWITSYDTYGLSSLTSAGILGYGGYRLLSSIDGVWYDIKKAGPNQTIFTTSRYTFKGGIILRDVGKAVAGITMIGAGILSANDFFSGNFYTSKDNDTQT